MKKIYSLLTIFIIAFIGISCDNNDDDDTNNNPSGDFIENFGNSTAKDFMGQVVDENNNPIENVTIRIGNSTAMTDQNGVFIINNASVYEKFAYIKAEKAGYINGSRSVLPTNGLNQVKIRMIVNTPIATINSGQNSEVDLPNGTKVTFDGAFKNENGMAYTGAVSVSMYHLEASNSNISEIMPGMLLAEAEDGSAKVLETFGMLNVELTGSSGEKLQIADGHNAQISMKIDMEQSGNASSSIPLWHFDEENGYWKEDGVATKQGDYYVGNVSHFSWWNCDAPFPVVNLCISLVNDNNEPLSGVQVDLSFAGQTYPRSGVSNGDGEICGLVPANETITLEILDTCGNVVYTSTIGPFSVNTVLPAIVVPSGSVTQSLVQGTLVTCNNQNITNGYVILNSGNETIVQTVTNGVFSFNTLVCSANDSFTLQGFDYDTLQTTGIINYMFNVPITTIGNLQACTTVSEFISYQIDNEPVDYFISNLSAEYSPNGLYIYIPQNDDIYLGTNDNVLGIKNQFYVGGLEVGYITQSNVGFTFILNSFGAVGDYIDITFYGNYIGPAGNPHYISGVVHVIRDN